MLIFPVVVARDGPGYVVSFPDIPEALTSGKSRKKALDMARDALETAIEFYFEDNRAVPVPGKRDGPRGVFNRQIGRQFEFRANSRTIRPSKSRPVLGCRRCVLREAPIATSD